MRPAHGGQHAWAALSHRSGTNQVDDQAIPRACIVLTYAACALIDGRMACRPCCGSSWSTVRCGLAAWRRSPQVHLQPDQHMRWLSRHPEAVNKLCRALPGAKVRVPSPSATLAHGYTSMEELHSTHMAMPEAQPGRLEPSQLLQSYTL